MPNADEPRGILPVTLDIGPAVHQRAGLSRYAERLAANLFAHERSQVDLTLFYNRHSDHSLPPSLTELPYRSLAADQRRWRLGVLASQLAHSRHYERALLGEMAPGTQLYHATEHLLPYLRCPTVLTVHDLIFERYPEHHTRINRLFLRQAMPRFARAADAIIAVSRQTRHDLIELYAIDERKITVIYQGIDERFRPADPDETERVRRLYADDQPYLLMVGTLEPRKNHAAAMRALARLREEQPGLRLLISGAEGWLFEPVRQMVEELGLGERVIFAGYVPGADLPALYSGATCLLQPSLYEGFGFPVLEAMACGAPVICSNSGSLPEAAGGAALMIDPDDDEALAASIRRVLGEPGLAEHLREAGLKQAGAFSWSDCARQTVEVYRGLLDDVSEPG